MTKHLTDDKLKTYSDTFDFNKLYCLANYFIF